MDLGHLALLLLGAAACLVIARQATRRHGRLAARLNEDQAFLSAVLDSINDGIVACDADGLLALFNRAACDMHGLPQQPILSADWAEQYDLYHADGKTPLTEQDIPLYRALTGELVKDSEIVIAPAGRDPLQIRSSGRAMFGPDGRKLGAVVSMHDVTAETRALDESRQVHQIIESSPNIVFKWKADDDWTVEYVSSNVRQLGFDPEDFFDGSIAFPSLIHAEDYPRIIEEIESRLADDSGHFLLSFRIIDDVGRDRWVDTWMVIIRNDAGAVTHYHGIMVDVTDRELIARMLSESEERMELALRGADLGMWDWDLPSGRAVFNERWCEMLGLAVEDVDNHVSSWESKIHPDDQEHVMAALQAHLNGDTPIYETEHRLRHAGGGWVWVLDRGCVTSRDHHGAALRMTGTHLDLTARKKADEEARLLEFEVHNAQKMDSLGMLAGGIAHDFNNILMAILGNAELSRLSMDEQAPALEQIKEIEDAAGRAADLCNQMLTYSGKGSFQTHSVNLVEEIKSISRMLSVGIPKSIELRFDFDGPQQNVRADASQMRQVIMNLITNAAEAIGNDVGSIEVRVHGLDASTCPKYIQSQKSCTACSSGCLRLEVADTGCGMDEETSKRIFEPFYTTKVNGRGLGMAAVAGIVRAHGGNISVDSRPGLGTTISLCLPCNTSVTDTAAPGSLPEAAPAPEGGRILLVDDEESVLKLGVRLLNSLGWTVQTAVDGLAALRCVEQCAGELSCIILDVTMPHMGGIEAREKILRRFPELPVILSSGYHGIEIAKRAGEHALFIQKPYLRRDLARMIEKATGALV